MKKVISIGLIIILTAGIAMYIGVIKSPIDNNEVGNKVKEHILNTGISKDNYKIEVKYYWKNKLLGYNPYRIKVVFKDEPDVNYYYEYSYKSQIKEVTQTGIAPIDKREDKNFKHME